MFKTIHNIKYFLFFFVIVIYFFGFIAPQNKAEAACDILSAKFERAEGGLLSEIDPETYFDDNNAPRVYIHITTKGCAGQELLLRIGVVGGGQFSPGGKSSIIIGPDDKLSVLLTTGENFCNEGTNPHCQYFIALATPGGWDVFPPEGSAKFASLTKPDGKIEYNCFDDEWWINPSGNCSAKWKYVGTEPPQPGENGIQATLDSLGPDPNSPCTITDPETGELSTEPGCNELLAPLPGLDKVTDETTLGEYINKVVKLIVGLIAVLTVIMIIVGGVQYMTTDAFTTKETAKETIRNAILGLLLALGSFILLYSINPRLTDLDPNISSVSVEYDGTKFISNFAFKNITGEEVLTADEYYLMGKLVAEKVGIPYCVMETIITMESGGDPKAIGQDENVPGTKSNQALKNVDKLYSGRCVKKESDETNTQGNDNQDSCVINPAVNDNKVDSVEGELALLNNDHMGLDWRFSQGIGLTQITFFPLTYFSKTHNYIENPPEWESRTAVPKKQINVGGQIVEYQPKDLLNAKTNLEAGAYYWKSHYLNPKCYSPSAVETAQNAFTAYNGGNCTNPDQRAIEYGIKAMAIRAECEFNPKIKP